MGWAGAVEPYAKSIHLFKCPDDSGTSGSYMGYYYYPVSYGMNLFVENVTLAKITQPASCVLASEVLKSFAYLGYTERSPP